MWPPPRMGGCQRGGRGSRAHAPLGRCGPLWVRRRGWPRRGLVSVGCCGSLWIAGGGVTLCTGGGGQVVWLCACARERNGKDATTICTMWSRERLSGRERRRKDASGRCRGEHSHKYGHKGPRVLLYYVVLVECSTSSVVEATETGTEVYARATLLRQAATADARSDAE